MIIFIIHPDRMFIAYWIGDVPIRERGETGRGFGTTRQTYIWVESKAEIRTKMELYKSLMESLNN